MNKAALMQEAGQLVSVLTDSARDFVQARESLAESQVWASAYSATISLFTHDDDYTAVAMQVADDAVRAWRERGERGL